MFPKYLRFAVLALALPCLAPGSGLAQPAGQDDPAALKLEEPDFTIVTLPTALRLPTFGSAFRVTHRFIRPLNDGSFGDLSGDLFGIDNGAAIGLEYRFGIIRNGQIGFYRTSNRTIELFGQYDVSRQGTRLPIGVAALVSVEGTNNFKDSYSPAIGAILSRGFGDRAAVYAEPIWINNTNPLPKEVVDNNDTFMVGVGARVRIRPTVYVSGEVAPHTGYKPGYSHVAFAIEKRAGGHLFQLNFSDSTGTTLAQIARGAAVSVGGRDWHMGFNISRKFF
jgi:hypothetical protein